MPIQSKVELNTIEFPDALEFTVSREEGMAERVVFPIFALIVFVWFWSIGSLWPRIIAAFAGLSFAASLIANRVQGGKSILRVTVDGLVADGNLRRPFSTHEEVGAGELSSIRYFLGGDGEISGLAAQLSWRSVVLLPHISTDQANAIMETINRKFSSMPIEHYSALSLSDVLPLFGRGDQVTKLGLSGSDENTSGHTDQNS